MRHKEAIKILKDMDAQGRRVFTGGDFRKIFRGDSDRALADGIQRLVRDGVLERPAKGVYVNANTRHPRTHLIYEVARTLRRGCHTYLSLESALSEWGLISQVPFQHTFMTTGRRGEFKTGYGTIEFTHTTRHPADFVEDLRNVHRPLPIASPERAMMDLRRVGRNLHLLQEVEENRREATPPSSEEDPDASF